MTLSLFNWICLTCDSIIVVGLLVYGVVTGVLLVNTAVHEFRKDIPPTKTWRDLKISLFWPTIVIVGAVFSDSDRRVIFGNDEPAT